MKHKILSVIMALILTFLLLFNMLPTIIWANDSEWRPMHVTQVPLHGVWGDSVFDVFAVGGGDTIIHYNGSNWSTMNIQTRVQLNAVWGSLVCTLVVGQKRLGELAGHSLFQ